MENDVMKSLEEIFGDLSDYLSKEASKDYEPEDDLTEMIDTVQASLRLSIVSKFEPARIAFKLSEEMNKIMDTCDTSLQDVYKTLIDKLENTKLEENRTSEAVDEWETFLIESTTKILTTTVTDLGCTASHITEHITILAQSPTLLNNVTTTYKACNDHLVEVSEWVKKFIVELVDLTEEQYNVYFKKELLKRAQDVQEDRV